MSNKILISDNSEWEAKVGYSRAIKIGNVIEIPGTAAYENGEVIGINDPYLQTKFILEKICHSLTKLQCSIEYIIRTRIYVTDIKNWPAIGQAHNEFFHNIDHAVPWLKSIN